MVREEAQTFPRSGFDGYTFSLRTNRARRVRELALRPTVFKRGRPLERAGAELLAGEFMTDPAAGERTPRILLIKDEVDERAKMASTLRGAGFEVLEVGNGLAGIEAAMACRPDLLLVDLHLPDLDGSEVASKLRRLGLERLPIVALGKPGNERGVALAAGCDATIPSPPDLALLPGQVREFLSGKRDKLPAE
ncbi:MAG TPA: hypothetical protein DFS52_23635, partial [Myxococcales bacterium]|nr:hypothetical protein [Myxococcales bacterium]